MKNNEQFKARARELLSIVELGDRERHKLNQLSGGEQQRTAICRALINSPEVLYCNEVTGELDSTTADRILDLIK